MTHKHNLPCQIILDNLSDYLDGELEPELCADIEKHISTCQDCKVVINTLKKTIQLYQVRDRDEALPPEMRRRLYARLNLEDYAKKE
jgi:anti-sigma factor (TIGR02949 family)